MKRGKEESITLNMCGGAIRVQPSRILYIESDLHRVNFYLIEPDGQLSEYYMYEKLNTVQELLEEYGFWRIHQSYLINPKYLRSVIRYKAELACGVTLGISKKYYKDTENNFLKERY